MEETTDPATTKNKKKKNTGPKECPVIVGSIYSVKRGKSLLCVKSVLDPKNPSYNKHIQFYVNAKEPHKSERFLLIDDYYNPPDNPTIVWVKLLEMKSQLLYYTSIPIFKDTCWLVSKVSP